jgi:hypothetical protein
MRKLVLLFGILVLAGCATTQMASKEVVQAYDIKVVFYEELEIQKDNSREIGIFKREKSDELSRELSKVFLFEFTNRLKDKKISLGTEVVVNMVYEDDGENILNAHIVRAQLIMKKPFDFTPKINTPFIIHEGNLELRRAAGARLLLPRFTIGNYVLVKRLVKALAIKFADEIEEEFAQPRE